MNTKQREFFKALKDIKDANVEISASKIHQSSPKKGADELDEAYKTLKLKLNTDEEIQAYEKVQNEIIEDVICDIMVMIDGYGALKYPVDLIEKESNKSLKNEIELHDSFMNYLYEVEDNQ